MTTSDTLAALLGLLRAVVEHADDLEHRLGLPASAPDAPAMAAAWAVIEAATRARDG